VVRTAYAKFDITGIVVCLTYLKKIIIKHWYTMYTLIKISKIKRNDDVIIVDSFDMVKDVNNDTDLRGWTVVSFKKSSTNF
jgi:hypothetical protein